MDRGGVGDLRVALDRMIESAEFWSGHPDREHTPICWTLHAACALKRVRDALDGEDGED